MLGQEFVDKMYPPTHTYNIDTLEPTGVLKERVQLIRKVAPNFFMGNRFLDIGCNKGFFSHLASEGCGEVVAVDRNREYVDFCKQVFQESNVKFMHSSFRDFVPHEDFDHIFLGNAHHHLFMEIGGWEWISKLAVISNDKVLIEGPIDTSCRDVQNLVPKRLHGKFNTFMKEMTLLFDLKGFARTVSYTPRRYLMLFARKTTVKIQLDDLPCLKSINNVDFHVFETRVNGERAIAKVCVKAKKSLPVRPVKIPTRIGCLSPFSNGMTAEVFEGDVWVGWLEKFESHRPYRYFENEKDLFKLYCQHQIWLSKLGYTDVDPATINWFTKTNKQFDKSQVLPIKEAHPTSLNRSFRILFNQSYRQLDKDILDRIVEAFETRVPQTVERVFTEILAELA